MSDSDIQFLKNLKVTLWSATGFLATTMILANVAFYFNAQNNIKQNTIDIEELKKDNVLTARTPEVSDEIAFYDNSATAQGKMTLSTLGALIGGSSKWTADAYGINYQSGNVGIGSVSASSAHLTAGSYASSTIVGIVGLSNSEIGISGASNTNIGIRGTSGSSFGGDFTGLGCRATKFYVSSLNTAPASSSATGTTGEIRFTSDYIYVCVATNTWKRTQISTW